MKNSIAVARQTQAAETVASGVDELMKQVAELHAKVDALLDAAAHNDPSNGNPTTREVQPATVGRPRGK
jgi:uncharacterized coiled-coil protein SlyX